MLRPFFLLASLVVSCTSGFTPSIVSQPRMVPSSTQQALVEPSSSSSSSLPSLSSPQPHHNSRRALLLQTSASFLATVALTTAATTRAASAASPADAQLPPPTKKQRSLEVCLYTILRAKEATGQESRIIQSGKFKDVQRGNVKLAIKFILFNYQLQDTFISASSYIADNSKRMDASNAGTNAVQNLFTILEYFDSSDVQNIKVGGKAAKSMDGGKEALVLKGLDITRKNMDDFLSFFPKDQVEIVLTQIKDENALNIKEWDPSIGEIVNLPPVLN